MASVTASTTPPTHPAPEAQAPGGDAAVTLPAGGAEGVALAGEAAPPREQRRVSLARRMGLIAAGWISVLLLGGGIALERTLTSQVEANFDEQLDYILTAMISSAEIDSFGEVNFYRTLGDQRFLEPGSGLYWQVSGAGHDPWPSRSLWDRTLKLQGAAPEGQEFDSDAHFYNSDQFAGEQQLDGAGEIGGARNHQSLIPMAARAASAACCTCTGSLPITVKWPILRPGRAWCLPYRCSFRFGSACSLAQSGSR